MSVRRLAFALSWLVVACPGTPDRSDQPAAQEPVAPVPAEPGSPGSAASPVGPAALAPATPELSVARYAVCGREEAPARLFELSAHALGATLWAVSCGSSTHVISIEAEQGVVLVRRVALLHLPSPALDRVARPAPIALLEPERAWLVATLRADRNGSPAGGALFRVPLGGDTGASASRVHDASPGALALATLDRAPGQDFAVLQLGDARIAQAGELWLFSGGPAPQRMARRTLEPGALALAAIDLDGDGIDEVATLASRTSGRVSVHAVSEKTPPLSVEVPPSDGLYALDLGGNGKRVLVTSGSGARAIEPSGTAQETRLVAAPLPELDNLRDLLELDIDADGHPEIVGYAHPRVVAVTPARGEQASRRSELFELAGEGFAVLQARPAQLDGDGEVDLIGLLASEASDPQVDLLVATRPAGTRKTSARVRVPAQAQELRNAALVREIELR